MDCEQEKAHLELDEAPRDVQALREFCARPVHLEKGNVPLDSKMWVNDGSAFEIPVAQEMLKNRISSISALVQPNFQHLVLERGKFNEALSDMMFCGPLIASPMADVFSLRTDPLCCLASDQETKCVKSNARIPLLVKQHGEDRKKAATGGQEDIFLFFLKPDLFAYVLVDKVPILLVNFENKCFATVENRATAAKTALLQYAYLRGIGVKDLVIPFMTMNELEICLYGLVGSKYWLLAEWNLKSHSQALDCLGSMYRLAQWLSLFAERVRDAVTEHDALVRGLQELVNEFKPPQIMSPRISKRSHTSGNQGESQSQQREGDDAERHAMEAELSTALHGAPFMRAFLPECHFSSTSHCMVFDPVLAPWHYRVDPNRWLKVQPASRADEAEREGRVIRKLHQSGVHCIPELHEVVHFSNGCVGLLITDCGSPLRHPESEGELMDFVPRAAGCLAELHAAGWVHGDVKESNFCRDAHGRVTLIDLEYAVRVGSMPHGYTCEYRAPEAKRPNNRCYSTQSDMYSFGVMLRYLSEAVGQRVTWSPLINALTEHEPSMRLTAAQVVAECQTIDTESPDRPKNDKGRQPRSRHELSEVQPRLN